MLGQGGADTGLKGLWQAVAKGADLGARGLDLGQGI